MFENPNKSIEKMWIDFILCLIILNQMIYRIIDVTKVYHLCPTWMIILLHEINNNTKTLAHISTMVCSMKALNFSTVSGAFSSEKNLQAFSEHPVNHVCHCCAAQLHTVVTSTSHHSASHIKTSILMTKQIRFTLLNNSRFLVPD